MEFKVNAFNYAVICLIRFLLNYFSLEGVDLTVKSQVKNTRHSTWYHFALSVVILVCLVHHLVLKSTHSIVIRTSWSRAKRTMLTMGEEDPHLTFLENSKLKKVSVQPDSNQWPRDNCLASTVSRSANWAIDGYLPMQLSTFWRIKSK